MSGAGWAEPQPAFVRIHPPGRKGRVMRQQGSNPCRGQRRYRRPPRERCLSTDKPRWLSFVFDRADDRQAATATWLLLFTGCAVVGDNERRWGKIRDTRAALHTGRSAQRRSSSHRRHQPFCTSCLAPARMCSRTRRVTARRCTSAGTGGSCAISLGSTTCGSTATGTAMHSRESCTASAATLDIAGARRPRSMLIYRH